MKLKQMVYLLSFRVGDCNFIFVKNSEINKSYECILINIPPMDGTCRLHGYIHCDLSVTLTFSIL